MKPLLLTLALSLCAWGAFAGEPIVTTIIARPALGTNIINGSVPVFVWRSVTNIVDVPSGQAGRVTTMRSADANSDDPFVWFEKNGVGWPLIKGDVIQGPVRFVLVSDGVAAAGLVENGQPGIPAPAPVLLTVERWTVRKATPAQLAQ